MNPPRFFAASRIRSMWAPLTSQSLHTNWVLIAAVSDPQERALTRPCFIAFLLESPSPGLCREGPRVSKKILGSKWHFWANLGLGGGVGADWGPSPFDSEGQTRGEDVRAVVIRAHFSLKAKLAVGKLSSREVSVAEGAPLDL